MKNISTFLLVFLCCLSVSQAQNGGIANNWYFGYNAGLNFNTGSPTAISGPINTNEGSAVISDLNGNLLFSTEGDSVFNSNNIVMPNGFGLWGHWSTTQSALIVPNPGNINQYYIFTAAHQGYGGIAYSIVDMTLNGGLGDVIIKNVPLVNPTAEKLTAVRHCNGTDFWVICHEWNSDAFYAYQVTSIGINAPIISNIGSFYLNSAGNIGAIGYLKSSPDGKRLAAAICNVANNNVELFDFDDATGIISNPIYLPQEYVYGLSFSPDNSKLYVSVASLYPLLQYDLTAANIAASVYIVATDSIILGYGALQLAPDGKIYGSPSVEYYLGVINNPNAVGVGCNYIANGVNLGTNSTYIGLPNFPDNIIATNYYLGSDITLCHNDTVFLSVGTAFNSYSWSTGDTIQNIIVNQAGQYWIEVVNDCGNVLRDTINIYSGLTNLGNDTILCNGGTLTLNAGGGGTGYSWSTGDTSSSILVNTNGIYWVSVTNICGSNSDTIVVSNLSPAVNYLLDTFVCQLSTITLNAASGYNSYQWNTGANTQSIVVSQIGQYYVSMIDTNGCVVTDSVTVALNPNTVPTATFTATANNNMNGTFTTNFTYTPTATNLQSYWNFGDGTSDTTISPPPHIYPCGQDYSVQHIISNECGSDTFELMVNAPCEVAIENPYQLSFSLYPNPLNQSTLYIDIENRNQNEIQFSLHDIIGKTLYSETLRLDKNTLEIPANIANGVYLVKVIDTKNNRVGNIKLTIMK